MFVLVRDKQKKMNRLYLFFSTSTNKQVNLIKQNVLSKGLFYIERKVFSLLHNLMTLQDLMTSQSLESNQRLL